VDKDLGFNFTGGGYSNELKQIVNCVKHNWDGSLFFLVGLTNKRTFYGQWTDTMGTLPSHSFLSSSLDVESSPCSLTPPQFYIVMVLLHGELFFCSYVWNYISYTT